MALVLKSFVTAIGPGLPASFGASGGTAPYVFSVAPGGAGGTINASSGVYTAPAALPLIPGMSMDQIIVTDALAATSNKFISVLDPLGLTCEIIQREMNLPDGRVWIWDQKINMPTDSDIFVIVSEAAIQPFANTNRQVSAADADPMDEDQSINVRAELSIDIVSRGPAARLRKEEVLMALNSVYSQQQQELNSFYIGKLPPGSRFVNLSRLDGAAIPYRFNIGIAIQYFVKKVKSVPYFDEFEVTADVQP